MARLRSFARFEDSVFIISVQSSTLFPLFNPLIKIIIVVILSIFTCQVFAETPSTRPDDNIQIEMRVLANHLPPYMIINRDINGSVYDGFEHDLASALASELDMTLKYIECEWQECQRLLKIGEIDVAHNLLRSKARESFLEFIYPTYLEGTYSTVFFQRFNDVRIIDEFSDLLSDGFVVGYIGSTVYFPQLENTEKLLKMDVKNRETGLRLLASGKIDVLAGFDELFEGLELENPNIKKVMKKSNFQAEAILNSRSAVSKLSPLFSRKDDIAMALKRLSDQGKLELWKSKWLKNLQPVLANSSEGL